MTTKDTDSPVPANDQDDAEGHAFKWEYETDAKGRSRARQTWDPKDGPAGTRQPTRSGIETTSKQAR
jgi:hypothetical protein